jgi:hypothetical protein
MAMPNSDELMKKLRDSLHNGVGNVLDYADKFADVPGTLTTKQLHEHTFTHGMTGLKHAVEFWRSGYNLLFNRNGNGGGAQPAARRGGRKRKAAAR